MRRVEEEPADGRVGSSRRTIIDFYGVDQCPELAKLLEGKNIVTSVSSDRKRRYFRQGLSDFKNETASMIEYAFDEVINYNLKSHPVVKVNEGMESTFDCNQTQVLGGCVRTP